MPNPRKTQKSGLTLNAPRRRNKGDNLRRWREVKEKKDENRSIDIDSAGMLNNEQSFPSDNIVPVSYSSLPKMTNNGNFMETEPTGMLDPEQSFMSDGSMVIATVSNASERSTNDILTATDGDNTKNVFDEGLDQPGCSTVLPESGLPQNDGSIKTSDNQL